MVGNGVSAFNYTINIYPNTQSFTQRYDAKSNNNFASAVFCIPNIAQVSNYDNALKYTHSKCGSKKRSHAKVSIPRGGKLKLLIGHVHADMLSPFSAVVIQIPHNRG